MLIPKIVGAATSATTGATSAVTALPLNQSGGAPKYVMVTALGPAFILPGLSGTTVTAGTGIIVNQNSPVFLDVTGLTHIAHIQSGSATTVNISPIEN